MLTPLHLSHSYSLALPLGHSGNELKIAKQSKRRSLWAASGMGWLRVPHVLWGASSEHHTVSAPGPFPRVTSERSGRAAAPERAGGLGCRKPLTQFRLSVNIYALYSECDCHHVVLDGPGSVDPLWPLVG